MLPTIEIRDIKLEKSRITVGTLISETINEQSLSGQWLGSKYINYVTLKLEQYINNAFNGKLEYNLGLLTDSDVVETILTGNGQESKKYYVQHVFYPEANVYPIKNLNYKYSTAIDLELLIQDTGISAKVNPAQQKKFTSGVTSVDIMKDSEYVAGINIQDFDSTATLVEERMLDYTLFNNMTYHPKDVLTAYNSNNVGGFFSPLLMSVSEDRDVRAMFFVDLRNILLERSNYKSLLVSSDTILQKVLDRSKIVSIRIMRYRDGFEELDSPVLVIVSNENGSVTASASLKKNQVATTSYHAGLRAFEFVDSTVLQNTFGSYRYAVELQVEDGAVALLQEQKTKLESHVQALRDYSAKSLSDTNYIDFNGYFTAAFNDQYVGRTQPWISAILDYLETLKFVTTISTEESNKLAVALNLLASSNTGSLAGVEYLIDWIVSLIQMLQDLSLYQRIDLTFNFLRELIDPDKVGMPSAVYLEESPSDGLLNASSRTVITSLALNQRQASLEPKEIQVNTSSVTKRTTSFAEVEGSAEINKTFDSRSAAMNVSELSLEFTLQELGYETLEEWAGAIGLGFVELEAGTTQITEKAAYTDNQLQKSNTASKIAEPFVNSFVSKLLKLPTSYQQFLERFGLEKQLQLLSGFKLSNNRTEPREMIWEIYTPDLYERLKAKNGMILCRLLSMRNPESVTIYNRYFLMK